MLTDDIIAQFRTQYIFSEESLSLLRSDMFICPTHVEKWIPKQIFTEETEEFEEQIPECDQEQKSSKEMTWSKVLNLQYTSSV